MMQTYFYQGGGYGSVPSSTRSSVATSPTAGNRGATNGRMPLPSAGDSTAAGEGITPAALFRTSSDGRGSPLLASAHQTTVPGFNPGLILMCRQAVAMEALRAAAVAVDGDGAGGSSRGIIAAALRDPAAATAFSAVTAAAARLHRFPFGSSVCGGDVDMLLASNSLPLPQTVAACSIDGADTIPRPASCCAWA